MTSSFFLNSSISYFHDIVYYVTSHHITMFVQLWRYNVEKLLT
ncbi:MULTISPECIES: hypothetical protein [unclassified Wolbachia]|nr:MULTISPECIES: hypothetical protein [unclassified Wolbachia]